MKALTPRASSNYDGNGRNACGNNTLYRFLWAAI